MVSLSRVLLSVGAVLALSTGATAFFFGGWGAETQTPAPQAQYYYHKRLLQGPMPVYAVNNIPDAPIPAIPVAVPLQAKLAPTAIQNVQLVPCLCPVQQDYGYEPQHQENVYLNPYQQPVQPPQQQQQQQKQSRRK